MLFEGELKGGESDQLSYNCTVHNVHVHVNTCSIDTDVHVHAQVTKRKFQRNQKDVGMAVVNDILNYGGFAGQKEWHE